MYTYIYMSNYIYIYIYVHTYKTSILVSWRQCQTSWSTNSPKTAGAAWILRRSGNHKAGLDSVQLLSALNML